MVRRRIENNSMVNCSLITEGSLASQYKWYTDSTGGFEYAEIPVNVTSPGLFHFIMECGVGRCGASKTDITWFNVGIENWCHDPSWPTPPIIPFVNYMCDEDRLLVGGYLYGNTNNVEIKLCLRLVD